MADDVKEKPNDSKDEKTTLPATEVNNENLQAGKKNTEGNEKSQEISTKEAYFASLNEWVKHANISQNAMALFPWYLMSSYPQIFQSQTGVNTTQSSAGSTQPPIGANSSAPNTNTAAPNANANSVVGSSFRILSEQQQAEIIAQNGGYEYVIAPFWKRAVAEFIDVLILLLLKIIATFTIMSLFDIDLGFDLDKEVLRKAIDDDDYSSFLTVSMDFLAFSSDLLMLEVVTKIIVCFYEAICTTLYGGATPGKMLMELRIQYVEAVLPLQPIPVPPQLGFQAPRVQMTALIYPAQVPTFQRALMRAVTKNLIMTLLFPMCFIMIFFKNNRTAYDIITKTIVVEANTNPPFRRQR